MVTNIIGEQIPLVAPVFCQGRFKLRSRQPSQPDHCNVFDIKYQLLYPRDNLSSLLFDAICHGQHQVMIATGDQVPLVAPLFCQGHSKFRSRQQIQPDHCMSITHWDNLSIVFFLFFMLCHGKHQVMHDSRTNSLCSSMQYFAKVTSRRKPLKCYL
jgi:hypothetical protein